MSFPHDHIRPFADTGNKKQQIGDMFNKIAGRYDFMNRFLSAGIDLSWRKKAIRMFRKDKPALLLDVATGTGDMAIMAARMLEPEHIVGIDISVKMLEIGQKKIEKEHLAEKIELFYGDGETINFDNDTFDGVMVAFGVRNFENLEKGLKEILRVLKPGARLVVLEFSRPVIPGIRRIYSWYMGFLAPLIARMFHQNKQAYQYLNDSANAFPHRQDFVAILERCGYSNTQCKPLSLGICCIYSGRKRKD